MVDTVYKRKNDLAIYLELVTRSSVMSARNSFVHNESKLRF